MASIEATPPAAPANLPGCPICDRAIKRKRPRTLYKMAVCRKCWRGFVGRREAAYLVDCILVSLLMGGIQLLAVSLIPPDLLIATALSLAFVGPVLSLLRDSISGISPGKYLAGLQVVDATTLKPIGVGASVKRNLFLVIPYVNIIFILIALVQIHKGQRIGERWANTIVVSRKHAHKPPFDQRGINCLSCGYNLTGNVSGICPECGTPISARPPAPPTQPTPEPAAAVSVLMTDNADHSDENLNG